MSGGSYTADVDALADVLADTDDTGTIDEETSAQLAAAERALAEIPWQDVPTVSAATAAAFVAQLRAARDDMECPACGSPERDYRTEEVEPGRTTEVPTCAQCGYPIGLASRGERA